MKKKTIYLMSIIGVLSVIGIGLFLATKYNDPMFVDFKVTKFEMTADDGRNDYYISNVTSEYSKFEIESDDVLEVTDTIYTRPSNLHKTKLKDEYSFTINLSVEATDKTALSGRKKHHATHKINLHYYPENKEITYEVDSEDTRNFLSNLDIKCHSRHDYTTLRIRIDNEFSKIYMKDSDEENFDLWVNFN